MSKPYWMRQCRFVNPVGVIYNAYIPEQFAYSGNYVDIEIDGKWEKGWKVVDVYGRMPAAEAIERSSDYRSQRKASDI